MEIAVTEAEALLADAHRAVSATPWSPPVGIGALPAPLEERARALLERQLTVARVLSSSIVRGRRHRRALATLAPTPVHPPVYLDVDG
jgi:hypothetical protein